MTKDIIYGPRGTSQKVHNVFFKEQRMSPEIHNEPSEEKRIVPKVVSFAEDNDIFNKIAQSHRDYRDRFNIIDIKKEL